MSHPNLNELMKKAQRLQEKARDAVEEYKKVRAVIDAEIWRRAKHSKHFYFRNHQSRQRRTAQ
jgi:hypothetical protein